MRLLCALTVLFLLSGCAASGGNLGSMSLICKDGEKSFNLQMPGGSGRSLTQGIKTQQGHACGPFSTGPMIQGEDRIAPILDRLDELLPNTLPISDDPINGVHQFRPVSVDS